MKQYVFAFLFLTLALVYSNPVFGDVEKIEFSGPPMLGHIERPEKDLNYDLCLLRIKNIDGEKDRLGVLSAGEGKRCLTEKEVNAQSEEEREVEKKLTRLFEPVEVLGGLSPSAMWNRRMYQFAKVVGYYRLVKKSPDDKGKWDSFCLAHAYTSDSGEEDDTLFVCNRESVPPKPGEKPVFTCPGIEACIAQQSEKMKVGKPGQIGTVAGEHTRNAGPGGGRASKDTGSISETSGNSDTTTSGQSGKTHNK